ncbi:NAD(P)/FAD-dependent oxidoreductase, partial [Rhizobiaceae sp. 2RAB30]
MAKGVVIVGAGHGGAQAAASLRQEGYEGPVTLVSDETDVPYHKPPLSKAFLKTAGLEPQILRSENFYRDHAIELGLGVRVDAIDPARRTIAFERGGELGFDHLILATGARPRRLDVRGAGLDGVFYLRSARDARALRDAAVAAGTVVVVGGGFIGLEVAASLTLLGKRVGVIEAAPRLLGRAVAATVSTHAAALQAELGTCVLTSTGVERILGDRKVSGVVTSTGETLAADLVIVGVGAEPNTELAAQAGLVCDNGITVDAHLQTSRPGIYAIGDCAAFEHWQAGRRLRLESVQNATDQARHVAGAIVGRQAGYREIPWFWSDQGPTKLQMVGLSIGADRQVLNGAPEDKAFSIYHFQGSRLLAVDSGTGRGGHRLGRRLRAAGFEPDGA